MTGLSNRILRSFSLVVTDRRWAGPMSAMALGFGLFIGVAIGPSAAGTLAGTPQVIEIPAADGGASDDGDGGEGGEMPALAGGGIGGGESEGGALEALPAPPPPAPPPAEEEQEPAPPGEEIPETEETQTLEGVVVHSNPAAGSYTIAIAGGELVSIHAKSLQAAGARLSVPTRRLENGTFAEEEKPESKGTSRRASIRGAVTFVDPNPVAPAYTLSGRGSSILIHVRPDPAGAAPTLPAPGSYATVEVEIEKRPAAVSSSVDAAASVDEAAGEPTTVPPPPEPTAPAPPPVEPAAAPPPPAPACAPDPALPPLRVFEPAAVLWQRKAEVEDEPGTYVDLAGRLAAICPDAGLLLLSADDVRFSAADLLLTVPAKIKMARLKVGDSYLATATIEPDGSLALAGLASDERVKGAEDPKSAQGDLSR